MGKTVVQTALAALLACSVLAPARCGGVSLADVTGASPARTQDDGPGVSFVGYQEPQAPGRRPGVVSLSDVTGLTPEQHAALGGNAYTGLQQYPGSVNLVDANGVNARPPHQGGVVSLSDVTGVAPPHPWPLHPERGYDPQRPYSPCYVPGAGPAFTPPQHPVNPVHLGGARLPRSKRSKRSPEPGVVRLEDVAGPNAGRYPSYGPPAYVRPSYPYYNSYYSWYRPQPYYNVVPLPCFGLWCL